nr:MAG: hypothetical protein DIU80_08680 [Chloroflexota bacterium]
MRQLPALRAALLACALLCALWAPPASAQALPSGPAPGTSLDADLGRALDRALAGGAPGAILAVSLPGQPTWVSARGLAELSGAPMTPQHRFRIASITKTFVAVVALQLVQEGWLSLDQTVEHWLPGLVPGGDAISVRPLLSPPGGLYAYMASPFTRQVLAHPQRPWQPAELVAYAVARGPVFRPGARGRWHYSNTNYVLLGMIIERATGTTLAHEISFRIIEPLGLRGTVFEQGGERPDGLAHGYQRRRDLTELDMSFAWAAGNMASTADDLARFARALFGGELLGAEMMAEMASFTPAGGGGWSRTLRYGLGLMEERLRSGDVSAVVYGHTGMLGGYRTALWYAPDSGVAVVAALNLHSADPRGLAAEALAAALSQAGREAR